MSEPVVFLVDSRHRDLDGISLIAHHLERLGIASHLEPLEAYKAAIPAHRPGMMVFNHMTASHLVRWSHRLRDMNVKCAVLPNEGISYDADDQRYMAGRLHKDANIDVYFCWNEQHRKALAETGVAKRVEVVGVPRFDFYFEPWKFIFPTFRKSRPRILVNTNFPLVKFATMRSSLADAQFKGWLAIPRYRDYHGAIAANVRAQSRFFEYVDALLEADAYDIVVRPHPAENPAIYKDRFKDKSVTLDLGTNVTGSILAADLVIHCETCTTALESWIAHKPTISLIFDKHPLWYHQEQAQACVECSLPSELPDMVGRLLFRTPGYELGRLRTEHLMKWCNSPSGFSSKRVADAIAIELEDKKPADFSSLDASDRRRALRLRAANRIGQAYHYDPMLSLKHALMPARYGMRAHAYEKSIKSADVEASRKKIASVDRISTLHHRGGHDSADLDDPMSAMNYRIKGGGPYNTPVTKSE